MQNMTNTGKSRLSVMWRLSWPAILEQLLGTMVSYVDTAMVGTLGAAATAAVSINASPIWLVGGILSGIGVGYSVQVANAVGARDEYKARRVIVQALLAVLIVGLGFLGLLQLLAGYIPKWMGADVDVLPHAISYLRFYVLCMPGHALLYVFSAVLRCTGDTKTPLFLNSSSNILNVILNFLLIYPTRELRVLGLTFTMPGAGMGVAGAAAASAISIDLAGLILLIVVLRRFQLFHRGTGDSLRPDPVIIRTAASLGLPYIAERMSINLGQITMTRIVASIGTVALAAHHIANTAEGLCYLPAYGISAAATALVGQSVGAQKKEDAKAYGILAGKIGFVLCVATAVILFTAARPLAGLFTPDAEVVNLATTILRIVSVSEPFFALSIVLFGALRGANDTRYPMLTCLFSMWVVRIVLTVLFVFVFHWGLPGVWAAMALDLILRGILAALRWRSGKWQRLAGFTEE